MLRFNRLRAIGYLWCLISMVLLPMPIAAQGATPATVWIAPAAAQVILNQTTVVTVEIRDVTALYGADISLAFDPTVVTVIDADPNTAGVQVSAGAFLDVGFFLRNSADNNAGTIRFALTQLNPSEPKSGSGTLLSVQLRGIKTTTGSPLTLVDAQLVQRDGAKLATRLISGQVAVASANSQATGTASPTQAAATSSPTVTSRPTATPTTILPTTVVPTAARASGSTPTITVRPALTVMSPSATATAQPLTATSQPTVIKLSPTGTLSRPVTATHPATMPPITPMPRVTPTPPSPSGITPIAPIGSPTAGPTGKPPTVRASTGAAVALLPPSDGSNGHPASPPNNPATPSQRRLLIMGLAVLGLALLLILIAVGLVLSRRQMSVNRQKDSLS